MSILIYNKFNSLNSKNRITSNVKIILMKNKDVNQMINKAEIKTKMK